MPSHEFALWAYGAAPGMELIPYFLALLAWVGMALVGVFLWPLTSLLRRLRGRRDTQPATSQTEPVVISTVAPATSDPPSPQ